MIKKAQTVSSDDADFVLKHRIAGAAFLLFFAALLLPWLLGPPSDTSIAKGNDTNSQGLLQTSPEKVEEDLNQVYEDTKEVRQEQVYISKITPANTTNEGAKQATVENVKATAAGVNKVVEKPIKTVAKQTVKKAKAETAVKKVVTKKPAPSPVKRGWIVSVGVFSKNGNVPALTKDLKSKGFRPSTTRIETSKGKATRVWLGPYAQRVEAAKVKNRLKTLTGEPGLIKAYP